MQGLTKPLDTLMVKYSGRGWTRYPDVEKSLSVIGFDTEAYRNGRCFMMSTSKGDTFAPRDFPACLFGRKYRGKVFVAFNLKYDSGALVQGLPKDKLKQLWKTGKTEHEGYRYKSISFKYFQISRGRNAVTWYDMYNFYHTSLDAAAQKYLGEAKQEVDVTLFTAAYVRCHWDKIAAYCVHDAVLVQRLAERLIKQFESYGVKPQRLYSVAYVSYQYFRRKTNYVNVRRYWNKYRYILDYAMASYNGGKFEVTEKGLGHYYEYDIVSAYPHEIANLVDTSYANISREPEYNPEALYGFIDCTIDVPFELPSPCVVRRKYLCCYPFGRFRRTITKAEYEYLIANGAEIVIHSAVWLHVKSVVYPYKFEIEKLVRRKQEIKATGDELDYHTIKILLNSLYGKMVQLIAKDDRWIAGINWNPIYGSIITANVRIRMAELQRLYPSVVAVHTDSVISTKPLPFDPSDTLGVLGYECNGEGVILGSGIYQIGDKVRFRGFDSKRDLYALIGQKRRHVKIKLHRPHTWREIAFHDWDTELINKFVDMPRRLDVQFDRKRIWLGDWTSFYDVTKRNVQSVPFDAGLALFGPGP